MRLSQWVCSRIISTRWKPLHLPTLQHARIACLPGSRLTPNRCACPVRRHNQCSFATFAKLLALPAAQSPRKPGPPICLRDFTHVDASALNTHGSLTHMLYYMFAGGPGRSPGCRAVLSGGRRSGADGLTVCRKRGTALTCKMTAIPALLISPSRSHVQHLLGRRTRNTSPSFSFSGCLPDHGRRHLELCPEPGVPGGDICSAVHSPHIAVPGIYVALTAAFIEPCTTTSVPS